MSQEFNKMQNQVRCFHHKFRVDAPAGPTMPAHEIQILRQKLIQEEAAEYTDALVRGDIVAVADALGDLLYVVFGACVAHGINIEPVFNEIHRSNMSKAWPDGSVQKRQDGKVIKPPSYSPADLKPIIEKQMQHARNEKLSKESNRHGINPKSFEAFNKKDGTVEFNPENN